MIDGALDVTCPRCGGLAAVDAEYLDFPEWACPFCGVNNPMPERNGYAVLAEAPAVVSTPWSTSEDLFDVIELEPAAKPKEPKPIQPHRGELFPIVHVEIEPEAEAERPEPEAERRRRIPVVPAAATIVVLAVIVWGLAVQAGKTHDPYRTVDGVVTALAEAGLNCSTLEVVATTNPLVREQAECATRAGTLRIFTFQDAVRRSAYAPTITKGFLVEGPTWLIASDAPRAVYRVVTALGGTVVPAE